jgi:hypothetical protein
MRFADANERVWNQKMVMKKQSKQKWTLMVFLHTHFYVAVPMTWKWTKLMSLMEIGTDQSSTTQSRYVQLKIVIIDQSLLSNNDTCLAPAHSEE